MASMRLRTQLGAGISGSVSERWRIISKDAEPEPITTPAWNTMASTGLSRNTLPTASRERMWVDRSTPLSFGLNPAPGSKEMHEVEKTVDAGKPPPQRPAVARVVFHDPPLVPP